MKFASLAQQSAGGGEDQGGLALEDRVVVDLDQAVPEALRPDVASGRRTPSLAWIVTLPFFAYTILFLFLPAGSVLLGAFEGEGARLHLFEHHDALSSPVHRFVQDEHRDQRHHRADRRRRRPSIAYAAIRDGTPRWVRSALSTFSGVAANFGGIPLAFAFISTLGPIGIITVH